MCEPAIARAAPGNAFQSIRTAPAAVHPSPAGTVIRVLEELLDKGRALDYAHLWLAIRSRIGVAVADEPSLIPTREAARRPGCHKGHAVRGRTPTRISGPCARFLRALVPGS